MPGGSLTCCCFSGPEPPGPARSRSMFNLQSIRNENESFDRNRRQSLSAGGFCRRRPCGRVRQTLFEVCRFHELSLRRIRSVEAKALERGRYAFFMLSQIENFDSRDRLWALGRILLLCDSAIDTFESMENREKSLYRAQVAACRDVPPSGGRAAAAVSPAVKQIRTIPHSECGD